MPSRNELLAEHYLKVAAIAAVHVDIHGAIGTEQLVRIEIPPGRTSFCCNAGDEVRLARLAQLCGGDKRAKTGHGPYYSIVSSARASIAGAISRPSVLAVLRLMTNSNRVGCSIGRSAGLAPLRILSTK